VRHGVAVKVAEEKPTNGIELKMVGRVTVLRTKVGKTKKGKKIGQKICGRLPAFETSLTQILCGLDERSNGNGAMGTPSYGGIMKKGLTKIEARGKRHDKKVKEHSMPKSGLVRSTEEAKGEVEWIRPTPAYPTPNPQRGKNGRLTRELVGKYPYI